MVEYKKISSGYLRVEEGSLYNFTYQESIDKELIDYIEENKGDITKLTFADFMKDCPHHRYLDALFLFIDLRRGIVDISNGEISTVDPPKPRPKA